MSLQPADVRARRGAIVLDEQVPGWTNRVDLDRLRMSSVHNCVLGQVFGGYLTGVTALGVSADVVFTDWPNAESVILGFNGAGADFGRLDEAWKELILERRAQSSTTEKKELQYA